ncbi:MAG TPA: cytochrome c biogenesis protein ResB [Chloroflexi bacterium]|jgi:hypothetical protein|nr:cytochrome c biogenesis protein ResB [Chloroflexota bacterium]
MGLLLAVCIVGGLFPRPFDETSAAPDHLTLPGIAGTSGPTQPRLPAIPDLFASRGLDLLLGLVGGIALLRLLSCWIPAWAPLPTGRVESWVARLPGDMVATRNALNQALGAAHMTIHRLVDTEQGTLAAARRTGVARLLPGLFYLGLLVLLGAGVWARHASWSGPQQILLLGEKRTLHDDRDVTIRLDEIELRPERDGHGIASAVGRVTLSQPDRGDRRLAIGLTRPARADGLDLYMVGIGPAVRIIARNAAGERLYLLPPGEPLPEEPPAPKAPIRVPLTGSTQEQLLAAPQGGIILRLLYYRPQNTPNASDDGILVQVLHGTDGRILDERQLAGNARFHVEGVTLDITPEYYVALRVEHEPEIPLAALGASLMLIGLGAGIVWPPRAAWLVLHDDGDSTVCRLAVPHHEASAAWARTVKALLDEEAERGSS